MAGLDATESLHGAVSAQVQRDQFLAVRRQWARRYAGSVRRVRIGILGLGLALGVVLAMPPRDASTALPLGLGTLVFAVASALTWNRHFDQFTPLAVNTVPLLDLVAIQLVDSIPGVTVIDALVVIPGMWLGMALGRRGIPVAACSAAVVLITPGLAFHHAPEDSWAHLASVVLLTALGAAGMAMSTEIWGHQVRRLERQGRALETAAAVKEDFIALVSHELRTPLTSIIGYLEAAMDHREELPEEVVHHLEAVSRNSDRLLLLVTDLLSASGAEHAPASLKLETVDVAGLASMSINDMASSAEQAQLTVETHLRPAPAKADPTRLLQVLDNLLSNAVKFTPPGGQITITTSKTTHDTIELAVSDTGVGIDAESLPHVGTKFFRSPRTTRDAVPGIGLGLNIAKTIVESHGGQLRIHSTEGEGTTVSVLLPVSPQAARATGTGILTPSHPSTGR